MSNHLPVKEKTVSGFTWNLAGQVLMYAITLGGTIIMSRLLGPAEFGLFGMLTVLTSLASLLVGLGLAHSIVQNQGLEQRDLSSIFWLNLALGFIVACCFFFCADLIASFYRQPELVTVTRAFSGIFLIYGLSAVPLGLLTKQLAFKQLVVAQLFGASISYAVGITMAYFQYGVKSLVVQALINHTVYVSINFYYARWRPAFVFYRSSIDKIGKFSRNFLPSQLLDFFAINLDMLLVGKQFGKSELGYYGRASALVQLPVNSLGAIFNKTFFSLFAELQGDSTELSNTYLRAVKMLTLSLMPILLITAIMADKIILLLFGPVWVPMSELVTILSIAAALGSYNSFNDSVMVSQGRTDLLLKINVIEKAVLVVALVLGVRYGLTGIVYSKALATGLMFVPKLIVLSRITFVSVQRWYFSHQKLFAGLMILGAIAWVINDLIENPLVALVLGVSSSLFANFVFLLIVKENSIDDVINFLKKIKRKSFV